LSRGHRLKKKHAWDGVKMMIARVGRMPTEEEVAYVTIRLRTTTMDKTRKRRNGVLFGFDHHNVTLTESQIMANLRGPRQTIAAKRGTSQ
jgi:hypothetical protein